MHEKILAAAAVAMMLALPVTAQAQGIVGGAQEGAHAGDRAAGPVGGIVGGVLGAVGGGIAGLIGDDQRPRFREYATHQNRPSYAYDGSVAVGATLPGEGVTYYDVPSEYGVRDYRYTIVNGQPVLVDPRSHRIVEVIE